MEEWINQRHEGGEKVSFHFDKNMLASPQRYGDVMVYQIGRMYCRKKMVISEHDHQRWFELTILNEGECLTAANGPKCRIGSGEIFLSFPDEKHWMESLKDQDVKYDFWAFYPMEESLESQFRRLIKDFEQAELRVFRDERINSLISMAISETNEQSQYSKEVLSGIYLQVMYYILRFFEGVRIQNKVGEKTAESICYRAMSYVDTHLYSLKSLTEVAESQGYNYSYFSRMFRRITGVTLSDYYGMRRLDTARVLIDEGRMTLTQIAEKLQYSSLYAFSKAFKNKFGYSPRYYAGLDKGNGITE